MTTDVFMPELESQVINTGHTYLSEDRATARMAEASIAAVWALLPERHLRAHPHLSMCDFFMWGHLFKSNVYKEKPYTLVNNKEPNY